MSRVSIGHVGAVYVAFTNPRIFVEFIILQELWLLLLFSKAILITLWLEDTVRSHKILANKSCEIAPCSM